MSDQENVSPEPGALHIQTTRAPPHLQAERQTFPHQSHAANCWICLSVGWPQTDASFRCFEMVAWSLTPYTSISAQYVLPRSFDYTRTLLGSLHGIPEYDTAETGTLFYPNELLPLP